MSDEIHNQTDNKNNNINLHQNEDVYETTIQRLPRIEKDDSNDNKEDNIKPQNDRSKEEKQNEQENAMSEPLKNDSLNVKQQKQEGEEIESKEKKILKKKKITIAKNNGQKSQIRYEKSRSRSRSNSQNKKKEKSQIKTFYVKECCLICKKNGKGGKTCICVVPARQRQGTIGSDGCQTCGCNGCSHEDKQEIKKKSPNNQRKHSTNQDRSVSKSSEHDNKEQNFEMRNGCCQQCLKAFSKSGRACLCQVPSAVRKAELHQDGCKYCGCQGCNPQDTRGSNALAYLKSQQQNQQQQTKGQITKNRSQSISISQSSSQEDMQQQNFNKFDKSHIGNIISSQLNIYPPLIGFGIPQRSYSYIIGKPKKQI